MKKEFIYIYLILISVLNASTVKTDKRAYKQGEQIVATLSEMSEDSEDWIGIYPIDSNNNFSNVLDWRFTEGFMDGNISFNNLPIGQYEARIFFRNSYELEGSYRFSVTAPDKNVSILLNKEHYLESEPITIQFKNMLGNQEDWIGIYPKGSSNDFSNVADWTFLEGVKEGEITFNALAVGEYEARVFFRNSYKLEAIKSVVVEDEALSQGVRLKLEKSSYAPNELVYINFDKMQGSQSDWIGIYPAGSSYAFSNVLDWKYLNGKVKGEISLGTNIKGTATLGGLPIGEYEVRAFFNNSLHIEKVQIFSVVDKNVSSTVYEDANGSISPDWIHVRGDFPQIYNQGTVQFRAIYPDGVVNQSEYHLPFTPYNTTQKVLEVDLGGIGRSTPHFGLGLYVTTLDGLRVMFWDSYFDHSLPNPPKAFKNGRNLDFSSPIEHVYGHTGHFKVNVEQYLRILEPDNRIVSIDSYIATGGNHDNIKLSSH